MRRHRRTSAESSSAEPELDVLAEYLREAAGEELDLSGEPHPSSEVLASYLDGDLAEAVRRHVRVHLLCCRECFELVQTFGRIRTEEDPGPSARQAERVVQFPLERLPAAQPEHLLETREWHEGELHVRMAALSSEELVVSVLSGGEPVEGAVATLDSVPGPRAPHVLDAAWGETKDDGEATLRLGAALRGLGEKSLLRFRVILPGEGRHRGSRRPSHRATAPRRNQS